MVVPLGRSEVFAFFSDASNLGRITPPGMHFQMLTPQPVEMAQGRLIDYRLWVFGVPITWRSEITLWDPPYRFVDEQVGGPYKEWVHHHRFQDRDGGTEIEDEVHYGLPFWPLGELAYPFVARQLCGIFRFRRSAIQALLLGTPLEGEVSSGSNQGV